MDEILYTGKWISFCKKDGKWEYAKRLNCSGAVIVPTLNKDNKLIFVEQYRTPLDKWTIEWPAGLIDKGESPIVAAKRELLEETGYKASWAIRDKFFTCTSAGITDEMVCYVICLGCSKIEKGGGIDDENIIIHEIDFESVEFWIEQQQPRCIIDSKIYAGLYKIRSHYPLGVDK